MKKLKLLFILILIVFSACQKEKVESTSKQFSEFKDLEKSVIGIYEGTVHDQFLAQNYPSVVIKRYNSAADMVISLKTDKIDAAMLDAISGNLFVKTNPDVSLLTDSVLTLPLGVGFNKNNPQLLKEFNEFLAYVKKNKEYDKIYNRWCVNDPEEARMPKVDYPKDGKVVRLGVAVADLPYVAYLNGEYVGFDIEILQQFAKYKGYNLEITTMEFGSLVNALAAGKVDMISDGIAITKERQKQINFSDEYMQFKTGVFVLTKNVSKKKNENQQQALFSSIEDVKEKCFGVYEGTVHDQFVVANYPKAEVKRFTSTADLIIALKSKKVDAIMVDHYFGNVIIKENKELALLSGNVFSQSLGIGFNKNNPDLLKKFNAFLTEIKSNGVYDDLYKRWIQSDSKDITPTQFDLSKNKKKLNLGIAICGMPYSLYLNEALTGFDIELIQRFAQKESLNLQITTMEFPSLIASLSAGKVDMIAAGITVTPERAKEINFSDEYIADKTSVVVLKENMKSDKTSASEVEIVPSFWTKIKTSFYNNIIFEKRYKLIIDGLQVTILISIFSTILGTLFGSIVCFMRMSKRKWIQNIARIYISILRGTPVLVLLMIIYYIVFASININPIYVAIFAFGINFAAYVSEMFRTGIQGIDKGQTEAGIALGFSKVKTFLFIILPQATKSILPVYKGEVISLVKMTSIVGYIAVEDLTKAGDIIRSRTFDAFFPLIMIAVLYFVISWILLLSLEYIQTYTEPKSKRKRS